MKKSVFVTGAHDGTGFAIAERFAKEGYDVFVGSREQDKADDAAKKLQEKYKNINIYELSTKEYEIFDPEYTWKRKSVHDFIARPLQVEVFKNGELKYRCPTASAIREYREQQVESLWEEVQRFEKPHKYYVDYSEKLYQLQKALIEQYSK